MANLFAEDPPTPGEQTKIDPASGWARSSASLIFQAAVVMKSWPSSSPPKQQLVTWLTGSSTTAVSSPFAENLRTEPEP